MAECRKHIPNPLTERSFHATEHKHLIIRAEIHHPLQPKRNGRLDAPTGSRHPHESADGPLIYSDMPGNGGLTSVTIDLAHRCSRLG